MKEGKTMQSEKNGGMTKKICEEGQRLRKRGLFYTIVGRSVGKIETRGV
jgi:hypothetical protein